VVIAGIRARFTDLMMRENPGHAVIPDDADWFERTHRHLHSHPLDLSVKRLLNMASFRQVDGHC
jgi:hypothetical protein